MADPDLAHDVRSTVEWLDQMLGQLSETRPWTLDLGSDPVSDIAALDNLRPRLAAVGIQVPDFPAANTDPMGNMVGWRDFLTPFVAAPGPPADIEHEPLVLAPPPPPPQPKVASWRSRLPAIVIVAALVVGGGYGVGQWTMSMGWDFAQELAIENNFCAPPSTCGSETNQVIAIMAENFALPAGLTQWCLGVAKWDAVEVRRGGFLKTAAVWVMALPCGSMFAAESAVKPL